MRTAIYARISSDRDDTRAGVERQLADCRAEAARRGWDVVHEYVDNDLSAYNGKARPEYQAMLSDTKERCHDAIIYWHGDRLHRSNRELEHFIDVVEAAGIGENIVSVCGGTIDLTSGDGRFQARILSAVAQKSSDDSSRRIRRKHEEIALEGRPAGGGTRGYGYTADHSQIVPAEAKIVRECAKRILAGETVRSVCMDLNERGVPTVKGGQWHPSVLKHLLTSPRLSGQRSLHGTVIAKAQWRPILAPEQTQRLAALLNSPARRTNRSARRYLLTGGLLKCHACEATLVSRPTRDGTRRYICAKGPGFSGCGHTYVNAEHIESFLIEAVLLRLDTPQLQRAVKRNVSGADDENDEVLDALADDQAQLDELAGLYATKAITSGEWITARKVIEERMGRARSKLEGLGRASALDKLVGDATKLRRQWEDLPLNRQRAIIAAVLDHAVVGPAVRGRNTFDPGRVTPIWRV